MEQGKPNSLLVLGDFHIFPTIKVNVDQQLFGYTDSPKNILFCVQHKKEMNTDLGQHERVNNDKLNCRVNPPFNDSRLHV